MAAAAAAAFGPCTITRTGSDGPKPSASAATEGAIFPDAGDATATCEACPATTHATATDVINPNLEIRRIDRSLKAARRAVPRDMKPSPRSLAPRKGDRLSITLKRGILCDRPLTADAGCATADSFPSGAVDAAQLLDVDVDELAGS
jgi:hypothetical protein